MINFLFEEGASIIGIPLYGICIMIGIIIAVLIGVKEIRKLGVWSDFVYAGALFIVPISILGARLWFVLFNLDQSWTFMEILGFSGDGKFGMQGLAIQGGLIAAMISVIVYCKKSEVSIYKVFDILAPGFFIGQIFGRWGNFFNKELYGPTVKNVDLFQTLLPDFITENMYINNAYRHPTFLYESLLNLIGLIIMLVARRKFKKLKSGDLIGFYLAWYGMVRIFTESLRSLSGANEVLMFMGIKVSILISIIFIIIGIAFLIIKRIVADDKYYSDILKEVKENKFDTLIFDLDGTLLDTKELIERSFVHTFYHFYPEKILTDEELDSFMGPTLYESFSKYEKNEEKINEMIDYYRVFNKENHDQLAKAFSGVKEVIPLLNKRGYKLAIVSSKKKDMIIRGLELAKISDFFQVIIGNEEVSKPKPSPEGILKVLDTFANTKKTLFIGDTKNDILAGKNANIYTCGVLYQKNPKEILEAECDYLINSIRGLIRILGE